MAKLLDYVERFNGLIRSRVLDCEDFDDVLSARGTHRMAIDHNTALPHGALAGLRPLQLKLRR